MPPNKIMVNFLLYNWHESSLLAEFNPLERVVVAPVFTIEIAGRTLVISNHVVMITVAAVLLLVLLPAVGRSRSLSPRGLTNMLEAVCLYIREQMVRPLLHEKTDKYIPFLWTIFFFVLALNLLGMIPVESFVSLITGKKSHLGGAATANIYVTGGLAVISFAGTHLAGMRSQGAMHYFRNFAPRVPLPMVPMIYMLEIVSAFIRPFALAIRLFANILAGHTLLATLLGLIVVFKSYIAASAGIAATVAISMLELFVAFLQAYIFTFLTTLFISFAASPEH